MKVHPGTALAQATQGPTAAQIKSAKGAAEQFAATLRATGLAPTPDGAGRPRQIPQSFSPDQPLPDKPRSDLPRGSLIDIRV